MTAESSSEVTKLLLAWNDGDLDAFEKLVPLVQAELHRLAEKYMRGERPDHALQPTALVNEAYLRLIDWKNVRWQNRAHFFAVSAQLMRRILVDYSRRRPSGKQGEIRHVSLDESLTFSDEDGEDLVALDAALDALKVVDSRKSQIVELRFFGGLSMDEIAEVLSISPRTVDREWEKAKAWLYRELNREG